MRTFKFLRDARYSVEDISSVSTHASVYFSDVFASRGAYMSDEEVGHTMIVCMFLAHSYVLDNPCSSRRWHRKLLSGYCTFSVLEEAIMHLMRIREYSLRIADQILTKRYTMFLHCATAALAS